MSDDDQGEALERELADVLGVLRRFEVVDAPSGLEERVAMKTKAVALKDAGDASPAPLPEAHDLPSVSLRCAFCHAALEREGAVFCASCLAPHHGDCFGEHGRCSAPGCQETRVVTPHPSAALAPAARPRRSWPGPLRVAASLLAAGLLGAGVMPLLRAPARTELQDLEVGEFKRARDEAMAALREYEAARRSGDAALARRKFAEAHAKLTASRDVMARILDLHRGHDDLLEPGYEAHAELCSEVERTLASLEQVADPDDLAGLELRRAEALRREGKLQEALAVYDRALARDPSDVSVTLERAEVLLSLGDVERAEADFSRVIERSGEPSRRAYAGRARARHGLRNVDGAIADLTRAIELDPRHADDLALRGRVRLDQGDRARALADFARAIELDPGSAEAFLARGEARLQQGDEAGAHADFARFLRLAPDHPAAERVRAALKHRR